MTNELEKDNELWEKEKQKEQENRVCDPIARTMEIDHYKHLDDIQAGAQLDIHTKYLKGVKEHGGKLWEKGLLSLIGKEMRAEAIDQVVYTHCLLESLEKIKKICLENTDNVATRGYEKILLILEGTAKDNEPRKD